MQRRVFIAINLPADVRKRLIQKTEKWSGLPVRWTPEENLHITLQFLGYISDEKMLEICSLVQNVLTKLESFEICLNRIIIGPSEKKQRMIWAIGEKSEELKNLVEKIEKSLGIFIANKKEFRPHVTLGRLRHKKWLALSEKPQIEEKINFIIPAEQIDIMESVIENGKRKYLLLESYLL